MRSKYAAINGSIGMVLFFVTMALGLVRRGVLIGNVGPSVVGLTAFFNDVLTILNMADIGLSGAIGAVLYKPIYEKNLTEIDAILRYFKKIYRGLGIVFSVLASIATLLIILMFKDNAISGTQAGLYFVLTAMNVAVTYFWSYRLILITTDQRLYYLNTVNVLCKIASITVEIFILNVTKSFTYYLIIELINTLVSVTMLNLLIMRRYPFAREATPQISDGTKKEVIRSLKGLVYHKLGTVSVSGTNYLYTTMFSGLIQSAIYSNYQMLIGLIQGVVSNLFGALSPSIGNVIATENSEKAYSLYRVLFLINFWIVSLAVIIFYNSSSIFMTIWIGRGYVVSRPTLLLFCAYTFFMYIRPATEQFKYVAGIFYEDRFVPLIEASINAVACLALGHMFGMGGVITGNLLSTLLTVTWQKPYMVFKYIFLRGLVDYFRYFISYFILGCFALIISGTISRLVGFPSTLMGFLEACLCSAVIVNSLYTIVFWRTKVFRELISYGTLAARILKSKLTKSRLTS